MNKNFSQHLDLKKIVKFQIVTWGGTVLNMTCLWLLHGRLKINLLLSAAIVIELAIIHNFSWYYFTVWKDRVEKSCKEYFQWLIKYNIITASIDFITNAGMGPTEFRIVVFIINIILIFWNPILIQIEGILFTAFDVGGIIIGSIFLVLFIIKVIQSASQLN